MTAGEYYKHSGKYNPAGVAIGLGVSLAMAAALAYAYAYVILYIPLAGTITFILSGGFGLLLGVGTAAILRWQKIRNEILGLAVTVMVTIAGLYVSWGVWVYALLRRSSEKPEGLPVMTTILVNPKFLWQIVAVINKTGAWTMRGMTPTGAVLWGLWGLETALILGVAVWSARGYLTADPFCERCETWCAHEENIGRVAMGDDQELKRRMEQKDFPYVEKQGAAKANATSWFRIDLHTCPACKMMNTLTVKTMTVTTDKRGKSSTSDKTTLDKLILNESEASGLKELLRKLTPAAGPELGTEIPST